MKRQGHPDDIWKAIPKEEAACKVVNLATEAASRNSTLLIRNWNQTLPKLTIFFDGRLDDALDL